MSIQSYFVTGTDTSAGKTVVCSALVRMFQSEAYAAAGLKPIASGFDKVGDELKNEDIEMLREANQTAIPETLINRYAYREAVAPHILAQAHGDKIEFDKIAQDVDQALLSVDKVIVEGVGGWLVPLNGHQQPYQDIQGLAKVLDLPVLLVVGIRLGCINHALLSAQSIITSGVNFAGWVANFVEPCLPYEQENLDVLTARMPVPRLFDMPYIENPENVPTIIAAT